MLGNQYPFNLIRDIYGDDKNDDTHAATTHIQGLFDMLETLTDQEYLILGMRYQHEKTLKECGQPFHVTPERARQIINKALRKLRHKSRKRHYQAVTVSEFIELENEHYKLHSENEQLKHAITKLDTQEINPLSIIMMAEIIKPEQLKTRIESLDLSTRSYNALIRAGIYTLEDVLATPERDLKIMRNLGERSLQEIKSKIREYILLPEMYHTEK